MEIKEFENEIIESMIHSYEFLRIRYFNKSIQFPNKPTYNSQIRIAETQEHYIAELLGNKDFEINKKTEITTRAIEKVDNINSFVLGIYKISNPEIAILDFSKSSCNLGGIFLASSSDKRETENRLGIGIVKDGIQKESATIPIQFGEETNNSLLHQIELLRTVTSNIYYRHISFLVIVKKSSSLIEFKNWFREHLEQKWNNCAPAGIDFSADSANIRISRSLISLSEQNITERILDKYISQHSELFANSMNYKRALPQIELRWIKRNDNDPRISIPDYLMESKDGTYHIIDLKKGFLGRKLVKGKIGRERFIDYVTELVAQLINYERYFEESENRNYAKSNYNIEVNNELKLIGVVGGFYEYDDIAVSKILKQYSTKITIISYFDLATLIRKNEIVAIPNKS
ncbi:hypothetical protein [Flavobacterium sp. KBS0721]|uniref:hypothetical protein n=1 Tax=Flavobacterium sp. KBS0721 TaxID=1179672 RepID=UPI00098ECBE9|nr:hypothetical protein [Flavobacterium sp. KBS0721]QDW19014.1 hypothetical protein B0M43_0002470 [Flavobacterium sp. KBS0721]